MRLEVFWLVIPPLNHFVVSFVHGLEARYNGRAYMEILGVYHLEVVEGGVRRRGAPPALAMAA